jgi:MFS family permease
MTDQFHSIADIAWYGSAYLLTMGGTQLLFGKLYVLHVDKTIYISSLLTFAVGSAICATAQSSTMFIVGRAMAGIGAAGQVCGALVIIAHTVPLTMRPLCTSIVGSMTAVGSVAGPLLGGVITSKLSWRWCFYMNLPIMGVLLVLLATFYRPSDQPANHPRAQDWKTRAAQYDPLGNLAFFPVVICFQIALEYGGTEYSWSNARVIVLFVLAAISLVVFIGIQWYMQEHATLPPHVAGQRTVASSAVVSLIEQPHMDGH